jgi:hypothetical protein
MGYLTAFMETLSFLMSSAMSCDCLAMYRECSASACVAFRISFIDWPLATICLSIHILFWLNDYLR